MDISVEYGKEQPVKQKIYLKKKLGKEPIMMIYLKD